MKRHPFAPSLLGMGLLAAAVDPTSAKPSIRPEIDTDFPTDALPPFRTEARTYRPPAPPKSNRQAAALEAALRRKARWEGHSTTKENTKEMGHE